MYSKNFAPTLCFWVALGELGVPEVEVQRKARTVVVDQRCLCLVDDDPLPTFTVTFLGSVSQRQLVAEKGDVKRPGGCVAARKQRCDKDRHIFTVCHL